MKRKMRRLSVVFVSMILFFTALPLYSQNRVQTRNAAFIVPKGLQPRVNFWIDIFTRYGDNHEVIHHRAYPQVVFMVLDFYTAAKKMNKVALEKYKKEEIKKHVAIVEGAARRLAKGQPPVSELEKTMARRMAFLGSGSKKYEDLFKNDLIRSQRGIKERYREALERSGLYLSHIEDIFVKEAGLPKELTRLPFVESSFDYSVRSSVGAAGIWQFMPATARSYKMMVNNMIDERLDVIEASRAAAAYLKHAYGVLGTWPLAITSYNHGVTGVARKVKTLGTKDITQIVEHRTQRLLGFASNNFYPEFLAALAVYEKKESYFPNLKIERPLSFVELKLKNSASIEYLTRQLHISKHDLIPLNYGLLAPIWSGRARLPRGYNLKIPPQASVYVANLAQVEPMAPAASSVYGGITYKVRKGDTLISLARKYNTTVSQLMKLNGLKSHTLRIGQRLIVKGGAAQQVTTEAPSRLKVTSYTVRKGDTLSGIAKRFGVSVDAIKKANNLKSTTVIIGQKITLPHSNVATSKNVRAPQGVVTRTYRVKKGDTLYSISTKNGVSLSDLKRLNGISSDILRIGQVLKIPTLRQGVSTKSPPAKVKSYTVRSGDTLWGISKKLGVSISALQKANKLKGTNVIAGTKLVVP